ncbi:MAG TPA: GNAT family N-acetyltransferase [Puia sp.]|jgi:ribosomal-protein-alanine N-acetyltransferase|nr:GNAT family N-acetyltransferase [Puia sp.]
MPSRYRGTTFGSQMFAEGTTLLIYMSLPRAFPEIKTKNLILRRLVPQDRKAIFMLRNDKEVNRFIRRDIMNSETEGLAFIEKIWSNGDRGPDVFWAICLNTQPDPIGSVCLWNFSEDQKLAELGYELFPVFQGRGLMSEAVKAVLDYAFNHLKLTTIEAYTHKDNIPSKKMLVKFQFRHVPDKMDTDNENIEVYSLQLPK